MLSPCGSSAKLWHPCRYFGNLSQGTGVDYTLLQPSSDTAFNIYGPDQCMEATSLL